MREAARVVFGDCSSGKVKFWERSVEAKEEVTAEMESFYVVTVEAIVVAVAGRSVDLGEKNDATG